MVVALRPTFMTLVWVMGRVLVVDRFRASGNYIGACV
jgi:hypothetical protein